jgi:hypothetical protein
MLFLVPISDVLASSPVVFSLFLQLAFCCRFFLLSVKNFCGTKVAADTSYMSLFVYAEAFAFLVNALIVMFGYRLQKKKIMGPTIYLRQDLDYKKAEFYCFLQVQPQVELSRDNKR